MNLQAAVVPAVAAAALFVGIRAETPWLGPKARDVFSVAASNISLNAGQSLVIATVPSDKRLVVTGAAIVDFSGSAYLVEIDEVDAAGATVVKVPTGLVYSSLSGVGVVGAIGHGDGLGAVFGSGTNVVVKNTTTVNVSLSYFVGGYYSPK